MASRIGLGADERGFSARSSGYSTADMLVLTRRVPFGSLWEWPGSLGHPILKLFGLIAALFMTVVLVALGVIALIIDIILLPFRLLL